MLQPRDLTYPVIAIHGAIVIGYPDEAALTTAFIWEVRSHYFDSLDLLDSAGRQFRIASATLPPLSPLELLVDRIWSRRVRVILELNALHPRRSFSDLQTIVTRYLARDPVWKSRDDREAIMQALHGATSLADLPGAYVRAVFTNTARRA